MVLRLPFIVPPRRRRGAAIVAVLSIPGGAGLVPAPCGRSRTRRSKPVGTVRIPPPGFASGRLKRRAAGAVFGSRRAGIPTGTLLEARAHLKTQPPRRNRTENNFQIAKWNRSLFRTSVLLVPVAVSPGHFVPHPFSHIPNPAF